jgi:hypothetical protein
MGNGFCFVERQKRMSVGKDDFYLDLLFYHRHLRRLVAIELKLESFQPSHKGQMELYLRWLDKHERTSGKSRQSASSCARAPMPNRLNSCNWMKHPLGLRNTLSNCHRCGAARAPASCD